MALGVTGCGAATPAAESPTQQAQATAVPATQAVSVVPRRGAPGGSGTFILLEGAGHGGAHFETESNLELVLSFLDKRLK
jgi:hypothetical protein